MSLSRITENQRAFTLIEVVLAFTLMVLMLMILYGSFALSSRAEEKIAVRFRANQKVRAVEDILAGYIRSAYAYRNTPDGVRFSGTAETLSFVSALSVLTGERGLALVTLAFVAEDQDRGRLTLQETVPVRFSEQTEEGSGGFTNEVILAEKLTRAQISYLERTEEVEDWMSEWDGTQLRRLPKAVRIILEADNGETVEWVFPIMVEVLTVT